MDHIGQEVVHRRWTEQRQSMCAARYDDIRACECDGEGLIRLTMNMKRLRFERRWAGTPTEYGTNRPSHKRLFWLRQML